MKMKLGLAVVSAVVAALASNALAFDLGVNIHGGGGSAAANTQLAGIMAERNLKTARLDLFAGGDQTALRDQVQKIRANGGTAEVSLQVSFQWDHSCNQDFARVEQDAYNQAAAGVNKVKDLVHDFELLNEVQLRPEILREVPFNSAGTSTTPYQGKPCVATLMAALRGMSHAIRDVRASSGLPLRTILGVVGRDYSFLAFAQQNGVLYDVVGWHIYPREREASLLSDPWYGAGGPLTQLAKYGKPVHINEFNCGETYDSSYDPEVCLRALDKHLTDLRGQKIINLESVHIYELLDEPNKSVPENRFGLMYDLSRPKNQLYLVSAYAGGNLSTQERYEITRRGLLTDAEIDAMRSNPTPTPTPTPAPTPTPTPESPHGTSITTSGTIVDANGAKWTVSGGVIYTNGVPDRITSSVILLLYWNHTIYQQNSFGGWWAWINNAWQPTIDPRVSAPSPVEPPPVVQPPVVTTPSSDTEPPAIGISSPADGSTMDRKSVIQVTAEASDNVGVKEVRFILNGTTCVSTTAPYRCQMRLPAKPGWTTLEAQAIDAAGNVGRHMNGISVSR